MLDVLPPRYKPEGSPKKKCPVGSVENERDGCVDKRHPGVGGPDKGRVSGGDLGSTDDHY